MPPKNETKSDMKILAPQADPGEQKVRESPPDKEPDIVVAVHGGLRLWGALPEPMT